MVGAQQDDHRGVERIGQVIGDRWTLDRIIGTGGMATVYEAHDASGTRAAVKIPVKSS